MQITSKYQGTGKANSTADTSTGSVLTIIGMSTQGQFFRETVHYSLEVDGFHFLSKNSVAEQASVLLEVANPNPTDLPTKIQAKVHSVQPSSASPGMFELVAQREGAKTPIRQMPSASAPVLAAPAPPAPPAKPAVAAPEMKVPATQPVAAPAPPVAPRSAPPAAAPPGAIPPPIVPPSVSAVSEKDVQMIRDTVARAVAAEVEGVLHKLEQHLPNAAQKSLEVIAARHAKELVREQLASLLPSQMDEILRQRMELLMRSLGEASGELRKRADEETAKVAGEYREKFKQALESELEVSKAQSTSTAAQLEQLRTQAAGEFEAQKAELRDWAASFQTSNSQNFAAAVEETRNAILAQMNAEIKAAQDRTEMLAQSVVDRLSVEGDRIASQISERGDPDFESKVAAAQRSLDAQLEQSKKEVSELLRDVEASRAAAISDAAELSNVQAQMDVLRQNLKSEMGAADGWMAKAMQDAMSRLSAEFDLRIADGLHQVDSDLQAKQAIFQKFVVQQLDGARGQAAGIVSHLEECRSYALQSLQTVETARLSIEQLREAWHVEQRAQETKMLEMTRRVQSCASVETTRLLNKAIASLEEKFRSRVAEMESSCHGIAAQAAEQIETSAGRLKKIETATAALFVDVDASLNRSTQTLDALNQMQEACASNLQQMLATEMENLAVVSKKQLEEQCKRMVASHVSALENQAALQVQAAEHVLQRVSEEQKGAEAACRVHRESVHAESRRAMEEFRAGVVQTTERLKTEVENATRQAHEALEQEFSLKIKYLADNTTDLVRRLFHRSSE